MKALILVDIQNDFSDNGSLAVEDSLNMIPYVNKLIKEYKNNNDLIISTKDFHPLNHISFASTHNKNVFTSIKTSYGDQTLWPDHCVENTFGSEFIKTLDYKKIDKIILKGTNKDVDSYSGFFENDRKKSTELDSFLKLNNIKELLIVGLALDYCVAYTAIDAIELNYQVSIDLKATRAITKDIKQLWKHLESKNIKLINKNPHK